MTEPKIEKISETAWRATLGEDPETGDLIMQLPEDLLNSQGWMVGDTLVWDVDTEAQTISLTKKNV
jgi:hypothetical protein